MATSFKRFLRGNVREVVIVDEPFVKQEYRKCVGARAAYCCTDFEPHLPPPLSAFLGVSVVGDVGSIPCDMYPKQLNRRLRISDTRLRAFESAAMISKDRPAHHPTDSDFHYEAVRHQSRTARTDMIDVGADLPPLQKAKSVDGTALETVDNDLSQNGEAKPADGTAFETVSWGPSLGGGNAFVAATEKSLNKLYYNRFTNLEQSGGISKSKVRTKAEIQSFGCKKRQSFKVTKN